MCRAQQIGCKSSTQESSTQAVNCLKLITLGNQTTEPGVGPKVTGVLTFTVTPCREYSSTANPTKSVL